MIPPVCTGSYAFATEVGIMAAALGAVLLAVFAYAMSAVMRSSCSNALASAVRSHMHPAAFALLGRVALTAAVVLYPTTVTHVVSLLSCSTAIVSPSASRLLDGGHSKSAGGAMSVTLPLLSTNAFYVCWEGSHAPASKVAIVALVIVVVLMPLLVLGAILRDPALRWHHKRTADEELKGTSTSASSATAKRESIVKWMSSPLYLHRGLQDHGPTSAHRSTSESCSNDQVVASHPPLPDPILAPFLAEYDHAAWWFKHVDLGTVGILAVLQGAIPRPTTLSLVAAKACVASAILCVLFCIVALCRPYSSSDAWKGPIKLTLILLALGCVALNASASALAIWQSDGSYVDPSLPGSITVGAYLLFTACVLAAVVLFGSFGRALLSAAAFEQGQNIGGEASGHLSNCRDPSSDVSLTLAFSRSGQSPVQFRTNDTDFIGGSTLERAAAADLDAPRRAQGFAMARPSQVRSSSATRVRSMHAQPSQFSNISAKSSRRL